MEHLPLDREVPHLVLEEVHMWLAERDRLDERRAEDRLALVHEILAEGGEHLCLKSNLKIKEILFSIAPARLP